VGLSRRSGPCLCRETPTCGLPTDTRGWIRMRAVACSRSILPPGKFPCRCRRSRVVTASVAARHSPQRHRHSRCYFLCGVSGYLRAYATDDARLLWEVDTARDYPIVNGGSARGGAIDGPGPTIVDGMLYVNSGYAQWAVYPATSCWPLKSAIPDKR